MSRQLPSRGSAWAVLSDASSRVGAGRVQGELLLSLRVRPAWASQLLSPSTPPEQLLALSPAHQGSTRSSVCEPDLWLPPLGWLRATCKIVNVGVAETHLRLLPSPPLRPGPASLLVTVPPGAGAEA